MHTKYFGKVPRCLVVPKKGCCIRQSHLAFLNLAPIFISAGDSIQAFNRLQSNFMGKYNIKKKFCEFFRFTLFFSKHHFKLVMLIRLFLSLLPIFNQSEDSSQTYQRFQKRFIANSYIRRDFVKVFSLNVATIKAKSELIR